MHNLITGGAGFIGSHLAEKLLESGETVTVIDDLSTGRIANIEKMKGNERFRYFIDTIMNEPLLSELIDSAEVVFHLAAAVGVKLIVENPVRTIETNIYGTQLVLKHAAKKLKKVILASTSEVYGKGSAVPFREESDMVFGPTISPRWSYATSKAVDEFLALSYCKEKRLPVVIVRIFNTVGPRQVGDYGMVVPRFVEQALSGGPITVYGSGRQTRCFAYVDDVVGALIKLSRKRRAVGGIFNIGSDEEISIDELARKVRDKVGGHVRIVHIPYEKVYGKGFDDMDRRVPDISRVSKLIGYRPTLTIDQILDRVIEDARSERRRK
jgi:UDP-glucose 4-epimerase